MLRLMRRRQFVTVLIASVLLSSGCGTTDDSSGGSGRSAVMPDLTGMPYSDATDQIDDLSGSYRVDYFDLLRSRSIWSEKNWTVMRQSPTAGRKISDGDRICLGVVKNDETWQSLDDMPCYESAASDDAAEATLEYINPQEVHLTVRNGGTENVYYRVIVHYELDEGNPTWSSAYGYDLYIEYCSDYPIEPGPSRLVILEMNNRYNLDESRFLEYRGKFRYGIDKLETTRTGCSP